MKKGNEKHEKILHDTLSDLTSKGYKIFNLNGLSPTAIAINNLVSVAIIINKTKKKTITYLEDTYFMFDKIDRYCYKEDNCKNKLLNDIKKKYLDNGFSFVFLEGKSPDGIAYKNGKLYAIEVLGLNKGYSFEKYKKNKSDVYHMFDGIMFKMFYYDAEDIFTETYGANYNIHDYYCLRREYLGE